ncbi:hypothetical protein ABEO75_20530 [Paenibacillus macerans]|uniref:hypothetical protein n=1 Tax=Paenibacillus macerans TaxID=44252 RepID=UPI002E1C521E|nr:hypothetical protein [Paenibacillus macerans]
MNEKAVVFQCSVCNRNYEKAKTEHKDFEITGLDDVMKWSDFLVEDALPCLDEGLWVSSDKAPAVGENRIVLVHSHFHMSVGESFWTLYTPILSSLNGWECHPEEIEASAFVKCKLERVFVQNVKQAWVSIKVEDIMLLTDLCTKIPPRDGSGYTEHLSFYRNPSIFHWQDWFLVSSSAEGDLGVWGLVRKKEESYHLITMGDWDFHLDMAYGGNLILPKPEWDDLLKKCTWYD